MRFRHRAAALLATLTLPLAGLVGLAGEAQAAESATASFAKTSDWGTGFGGNWTVKNTGTTTLNSWTVEWDFPSGTKVTSAWDATVTNSGDHWTAKNVGWNGTLAPGASVSFGFNGSGPGSPSNCKLNGGGCDGTSVPGDAAPSAPGTPTASGITDTSVKLSWSAATDDKGVKNYDVLRDGARIATVTGTTYTNTGLSKGTDYSYTVQARDTADQTGPVSGAVKVRTTGDGGGEPGPSGKVNLGYFTEWGVYGRNYHVKNLVTSGSASKITHINYAFGNVKNGQCTVDDTFAAYEKAYTADQSVSGAADTWDQPLRGNFNQLRQLKAKYPNIKILYSFGGWTYSGGFGQAAQNPAAFAKSCKAVVEDPRWADVFDGIDIDWEYPNACGLTCDTSGAAAFRNLSQALRSEFGQDYLVTAAITADGSSGGKLDAADYGGAAQYLDWYNVMTYDYFGAFDADGPTAPHSPLTSYSGIPAAGFNSADAIAKLKAKGVPSAKLLLGIGFYGRGWTGVTQSAPGGAATGAAPGTYEAGIEDYKVLKNSCPVTGTVAGTAYAHCGNQWWSYDTPSTIAGKMTWAKNQGLGGAFFWEFSGDTSNGELVNAINSGLK
ncbi:cellulose binding domain-containing protein [Streptomyces olivaceus]|uniref:glycoside hydrolase family 18 chitinase n=1 Tax=Streptomyces TaxID=1883 RepID=UPI001CCF7B5A|nr:MULTISPECIES: glycoside hydrolase family 18 chitinase [Streptomyces]MBZ6140996.1 cellulose binding domain-containing protein [Streptomyces olivaceus]MBZ6168638.1 cellulose binding domain-containing protein [Streptomyces olivaceus]MBZ6175907.1 cellulose binding domain-containing protein [Streptomyces olivaceus]MBZ6182348.1 cellulose binding domain-containing protein [Streptomyces olivaceus]MBZ6255228.1 cellulose binding domain-containing protein [Streptomyces olivaceus]